MNERLDLPEAWTRPRTTARLHLLRAHRASKAVIIRRKPSKHFHIISWDTAKDVLTHGSWFHGRIYAERCDVSWDGKWMVYMALGSSGQHGWSGICQPPWLRTVAHVPYHGCWHGGGYFDGLQRLKSYDLGRLDGSLARFSGSPRVPFFIEQVWPGEGKLPTLCSRLGRDGWNRQGEFGENRQVTIKHRTSSFLCLDDPGWSWQPTRRHPVLRMYYRGYLVHGYTFEFQLEGSDLLDPEVEWATWDAKGDLLVARRGAVERYDLEGLASRTPSFRCDLEGLSPPARRDPQGSPDRR